MNEKKKSLPSLSKEQMLRMYKKAMKNAPSNEILQDLQDKCCELEENTDVTESSLHNNQDIDVPPFKK